MHSVGRPRSVVEIAFEIFLIRAMFSPSETMDHMHKYRVTSVHRMCWRVIYTIRALRSARNASAAHKANHTITELDLCGNAIGSDGALAIADGLKAVIMMCASFGT